MYFNSQTTPYCWLSAWPAVGRLLRALAGSWGSGCSGRAGFMYLFFWNLLILGFLFRNSYLLYSKGLRTPTVSIFSAGAKKPRRLEETCVSQNVDLISYSYWCPNNLGRICGLCSVLPKLTATTLAGGSLVFGLGHCPAKAYSPGAEPPSFFFF